MVRAIFPTRTRQPAPRGLTAHDCGTAEGESMTAHVVQVALGAVLVGGRLVIVCGLLPEGIPKLCEPFDLRRLVGLSCHRWQ
jgi:hypothetical protein